MPNVTLPWKIPHLALLLILAGSGLASAATGYVTPDKDQAAVEVNGKSTDQSGSSPLPGAIPFSDELTGKFQDIRKQRGKDYQPRTRHLRPDGWAVYTNRLFLQSSPYLLQHAHNPVNWFPWGDEAFELARRLNRPVLISIGYSTCHWCHVMEDESFEDEEIARYLNENFIAVKVDREERPDLDDICMNTVQALTGKGGWPLNVWMTPDRKPFYGGTYFAPYDFMKVLKSVKDAYVSRPEEIAESSRNLVETVQSALSTESSVGLPPAGVMDKAALVCRDRFDKDNGGETGAPKFPNSLPVRFLLRYQQRTGKGEFLEMAELTLKKMAAGGIYDQVGGGFHRYSTDEQWQIPHFEKMLYDNALLAVSYLEGYQATGNADFARVTRETLRYLERDMSSPDGAFYSASDADSTAPGEHREEGYFFSWSPKEVEQVVGKERAKVFNAYYGVTNGGNFQGRNILHAQISPAAVAKSLNIPEARVKAIIDESKELLYQERSRRPHPPRDEKIVTAWNALAISAFARAGLILADEHYVERAVKTARFILQYCNEKEKLSRSFQEGKARGSAYLDDYAFLIGALIDLFEATGDGRWLEKAVKLDEVLERHFEDREKGGFYMTGDDQENLFMREKPSFDESPPSGNSVQLMNLLRLAQLTTQESYGKRAGKALRFFSGNLSSEPDAISEMLLAVDYFHDTAKEVVIVAPKGNKEAASSLLNAFRGHFLPNRIFILVAEGDEFKAMRKLIPFLEDKKALKGRATAYFCENKSCRLPTGDSEVFAEQLRKAAEGYRPAGRE
jgi:uncharacterized protein YyaL (SSP411 family)